MRCEEIILESLGFHISPYAFQKNCLVLHVKVFQFHSKTRINFLYSKLSKTLGAMFKVEH